jgi:hypothetical protein
MTKAELTLWAQILRVIRQTRNCHELGPHELRAEAMEADEAMERVLGDATYTKICKVAFQLDTSRRRSY